MREPNYDEALVGEYELPKIFTRDYSNPDSRADEWQAFRRGEILKSFTDEVFGQIPVTNSSFIAEVNSEYRDGFTGKSLMSEVSLFPLEIDKRFVIDLLLIHPMEITGPVPYFLGANFFGNHAVVNDTRISLNRRWMRPAPEGNFVIDNVSTESSRGRESSRWPIERILAAGFGLATFYYGDVEPDHLEGWKVGVRGIINGALVHSSGAISSWAWGLIKALEYLRSQTSFDIGEISVIGHSRLGKAALWAGANDLRFNRVFVNNAGAGAVSIARRNFGESIEDINKQFPHWYCRNFKKYNSDPHSLPIDMHQLLALIAPRPLYIASASEDLWADPQGERESIKQAQPVFDLLGGGSVGYHLRPGGHDMTYEDWDHFLEHSGR